MDSSEFRNYYMTNMPPHEEEDEETRDMRESWDLSESDWENWIEDLED